MAYTYHKKSKRTHNIHLGYKVNYSNLVTSLASIIGFTMIYTTYGPIFVLVAFLNNIQAIPHPLLKPHQSPKNPQDMSMLKGEAAQAMMRELFAMESNTNLLASLSLPMSLSFSLPSLSRPLSTSPGPTTIINTNETIGTFSPDFVDNSVDPFGILTAFPTSKESVLIGIEQFVTTSPTSNDTSINGSHELKPAAEPSSAVLPTNKVSTSQGPNKAAFAGSATNGRLRRVPSGGAIAGFVILAILAVAGLALLVKYLVVFKHNNDSFSLGTNTSSKTFQHVSSESDDMASQV